MDVREKKKIISRLRGYHGVTVASASLTGLPANHADFDLPIAEHPAHLLPHHYRFALAGESEEEFATRMAQDLEDQILAEGPETVAAFIAEPVMGAGGVILPPATYFEKIQAVLDRYDVLFIADEVITGFGRLGTPFGSEKLGIRPDTISFAKALTSAYLPLGGLMIPETMYQAMLDESRKLGTFGHGFTYSGHPVAAAVAVKTLEIYEREKFSPGVERKAPLFLRRLERSPIIPSSARRGASGSSAASRSWPTSDEGAIRSESRRRGEGRRLRSRGRVIVRALYGDRIAICPPLIISEAEIDELFDRLGRALDKTADWLSREGPRAA